MLIYKATNTLDGYLPSLPYTGDKSLATVMLVGGRKFDLDDFPSLRGVFKTGVGTDNLDFELAQRRGVAIALPSEKSCNVIFEETAAFSCHLILSGLYGQPGKWDTWEKFDRKALGAHRLLVIGCGRIGGRVAQKMRPFMDVATFDSLQDPPELLEQKIRAADCVTLHLPLTPDTRGFFDARRLSWLRDGALLVNTARGALLDEEALYAELASGRLKAALDVFWEEPYRGKLTGLPPERLIRTPHIASTCREFIEGTASDFLQFLRELTQPSEGRGA